LEPEYVALVGVLLGAFIGSTITLIGTLVRAKSEERKHHKELVFKTAIANFEQACEMARSQGGAVPPIDVFLIHMVKVSELIVNQKLNSKSMEDCLQEINTLVDALQQHQRNSSPSNNERS
jgi:hypothetical protein